MIVRRTAATSSLTSMGARVGRNTRAKRRTKAGRVERRAIFLVTKAMTIGHRLVPRAARRATRKPKLAKRARRAAKRTREGVVPRTMHHPPSDPLRDPLRDQPNDLLRNPHRNLLRDPLGKIFFLPLIHPRLPKHLPPPRPSLPRLLPQPPPIPLRLANDNNKVVFVFCCCVCRQMYLCCLSNSYS